MSNDKQENKLTVSKHENYLDSLKNYSDEANKMSNDKNKYIVYDDDLNSYPQKIFSKFNPIKMIKECDNILSSHFADYIDKKEFLCNSNGFSFTLKDKSGDLLCTISREFIFDEDDENLEIYNDTFFIEKGRFLGGGLMKKLFCEFQEHYENMGIKKMKVTAAGTHGVYVWPTIGFTSNIEDIKSNIIDKQMEGLFACIHKEYVVNINTDLKDAYRDTDSRIYFEYKNGKKVDVSDEKCLSRSQIQRINNLKIEISKNIDNKEFVEQKKYAISEIEKSPVANRYSIEKKDVVDNLTAVYYTITPEDESKIKQIFNNYYENNYNENFTFAALSEIPSLKNAIKTLLITQTAHLENYELDLTDKIQSKIFKTKIGYKS